MTADLKQHTALQRDQAELQRALPEKPIHIYCAQLPVSTNSHQRPGL